MTGEPYHEFPVGDAHWGITEHLHDRAWEFMDLAYASGFEVPNLAQLMEIVDQQVENVMGMSETLYVRYRKWERGQGDH